MYAIKAWFDGVAIIPTEAVQVTGPYEALVTFTRPVEPAGVPDDLDEFFGCFRDQRPWTGDSVGIIREMRDAW